jgi:hypothetical protein
MINGHYIKAGEGIDPTKKVYYNRPTVVSGITEVPYDEPWLFDQNWDAPYLITNGILQQIDNSVSPDYLVYYNSFGHKFRLTGLYGGYYDFNDGNYKTSAGTTSDFDTEFKNPVGATLANDGYVIDHFTGLGWRCVRGGAATWYAALSGIPALTVFTYSDWKNPPINYWLTLFRPDVSQWMNSSFRPPFQHDQFVQWSCTTLLGNPLHAHRATTNAIAGSAVKTTTGANRVYMRLHYSRTDFVTQP